MKHAIITIILFLYGIVASAQNLTTNSSLDRIEKLLSHHKIEAADSLLRQESWSYGNAHSAYKADCVVGELFYYQEKYEESISVMSVAISKMDSLKLWDCEHYLKVAYYIADSYIHLNKFEECGTIINYALVKCVDSYSNCTYAKKLYQLLLFLYDKMAYSPSVIEQVHNEIQKIAVNIYSLNNSDEEASRNRDQFMYWYNYGSNQQLSQEDSLMIDEGKAFSLYTIGEYVESIRLFEKVKEKRSRYYEHLKVINESLLIMYSCTGQVDSIERLLREMYEYSTQMHLDYDPYVLNVWVGSNLHQYNFYQLAQEYFERGDSYLNANKSLQDWIEKKKNVLSKMVYTCREIGAYDQMINYCEEYSELLNDETYDELFFVNYNKAYAYSSIENFHKSIEILKELIYYIRLNGGEKSMDYIMTNTMLGVSYVKVNMNNESIESTTTAINIYNEMNINDKSLLGILYNNLGKAYLQKRSYEEALSYLNLSADIQIEEAGIVSTNTQSYIDECNRQLK